MPRPIIRSGGKSNPVARVDVGAALHHLEMDDGNQKILVAYFKTKKSSLDIPCGLRDYNNS